MRPGSPSSVARACLLPLAACPTWLPPCASGQLLRSDALPGVLSCLCMDPASTLSFCLFDSSIIHFPCNSTCSVLVSFCSVFIFLSVTLHAQYSVTSRLLPLGQPLRRPAWWFSLASGVRGCVQGRLPPLPAPVSRLWPPARPGLHPLQLRGNCSDALHMKSYRMAVYGSCLWDIACVWMCHSTCPVLCDFFMQPM